MPMVECELSQVIMSETRHHQVVVLKEKDGERRMPIVVGVSEVFALHRTINDEPPPRPFTHELFGEALSVLGVAIQKVLITKLSEGTFFGRLILSRNGETYDLDSRPSDALVLATQRGAPIFVDEAVLAEAAKHY